MIITFGEYNYKHTIIGFILGVLTVLVAHVCIIALLCDHFPPARWAAHHGAGPLASALRGRSSVAAELQDSSLMRSDHVSSCAEADKAYCGGAFDYSACGSACGPNARCFLGRCFCTAGWMGLHCDQRRIPANPWYTDCANIDPRNTQSTPCPWNPHGDHTHPMHWWCLQMCFWTPDLGIAYVDGPMWDEAQKNEASIWRKHAAQPRPAAQPKRNYTRPANRDHRHMEHIIAFDFFRALPRELGDVLEIGAGPFTQTATLLVNRTATSVTLQEPNALEFLKLPSCTYASGTLEGLGVDPARPARVYLGTLPGEALPYVEAFDTVVMSDVLEHVRDALLVLTNAYRALRPGGILVFGERYFANSTQDEMLKLLKAPHLHPVRVGHALLAHFVRPELFEPLFRFEGETYGFKVRRRLYNTTEQGIYFIGRKLARANICCGEGENF